MNLAAIFIQSRPPHEDETDHESSQQLIASILRSIYLQLYNSGSKPNSYSPHSFHSAVESLSDHVEEKLFSTIDLAEQRSCLHTFLNASGTARSFLVIDGIDACTYNTWLSIERELAHLQQCGLRIFVTSRVPFQRSIVMHTCHVDACELWGQQFEPYDTWLCRKCYDEEQVKDTVFAVCDTCKLTDKWKCLKCDGISLLFRSDENCQSVEVSLDDTPKPSLKRLITWLLQREHGDLGLMDSDACTWPPRSIFGSELHNSTNAPHAARDVVKELVERSSPNVTVARLRLDELATIDSVEEFSITLDRLPRSIVEFFDVGIRRISAQAQENADLGIESIVMAVSDRGSKPYAELARDLKTFAPEHGSSNDDRHVEEVLHSAMGFLTLEYLEDQPISACHQDFELYVTEDYNNTLYNERQTIPNGIAAIHKSKTFFDTSLNGTIAEEYDSPDEMDESDELETEQIKPKKPVMGTANTFSGSKTYHLTQKFRRQKTWIT